ncbi:hypothetical protein SARC_10744, partial [Sphaeroforma arctica JP610]
MSGSLYTAGGKRKSFNNDGSRRLAGSGGANNTGKEENKKVDSNQTKLKFKPVKPPTTGNDNVATTKSVDTPDGI